jgi:N utilization substance protein B
MNREKIREHTMQAIYQMDATGNFDYTALNPITEAENALAKPQAEKTLSAVRDHIGEIDELIAGSLDKWTIDRIAKTDLAILRNAAAEMLYNDDIPVKVSIISGKIPSDISPAAESACERTMRSRKFTFSPIYARKESIDI